MARRKNAAREERFAPRDERGAGEIHLPGWPTLRLAHAGG
jgi:hypothetical protein